MSARRQSLLPGAPLASSDRPAKGEFALSEVIAEMDALDIEQIGTLWNPDTCPEAFLPFLAWALSVDVWLPEWSVEGKRESIRQAWRIHRSKGTVAAVKAALAPWGNATLREGVTPLVLDGSWSLDGTYDLDGEVVDGDPDISNWWAYYSVEIDEADLFNGPAMTSGAFNSMIAAIETSAPVSRWLRGIFLRYRGDQLIAVDEALWETSATYVLYSQSPSPIQRTLDGSWSLDGKFYLGCVVRGDGTARSGTTLPPRKQVV